jgi:hypothetical protein
MQTVPDIGGTEILIESTANGYNDFHSMWRKAEAGESDFIPVFLPLVARSRLSPRRGRRLCNGRGGKETR